MSHSFLNGKLEPLKMKHPNPNLEAFEFNLGHAPKLRCSIEQGTTNCGECENCILVERLKPIKEWFGRAGDQTQKRFVLGLVRRIHSVDLIQYLITILQPVLCKDFTYSRARVNPSLSTDKATMSSNRALDPIKLEDDISDAWHFFQNATYWTKSNFLLAILHCCDAHLLYHIGMLARTLRLSEQNAQVIQEEYELASIPSSRYSFQSGEHPSLELLAATSVNHSAVRKEQPFEYENPDEHSEQNSIKLKSSHTDFTSASSVDKSKSVCSFPTSYEPSIYETSSSSAALESMAESRGRKYKDNELGIMIDDGASMASIDPTCMVIPTSAKAHLGVSRYKDLIRCLPVHLSKKILGYLDKSSLNNCLLVNALWRVLVEEVLEELVVNLKLKEEIVLMQGVSSYGCNPRYAQDIDVAVPNLEPSSLKCMKKDDNDDDHTSTTDPDDDETAFQAAYEGYSTRKIIMESRNIYCGAYNVMVVIDKCDVSRTVDTNDGPLVVQGGRERRVRLVNADTSRELEMQFLGHAGSVRCVRLCEEKGFVLSGSFDTSIRKWSLETGRCMKIFRGHKSTVTCMQVFGDRLVSGGTDNLCKVWDVETGKCVTTFKHRFAVTCVAMNEEMVITGSQEGKVRVWDLKTNSLIKVLTGHDGAVRSVAFDKWHIVTGGKDGYALCWSAQGDCQRCLNALRHPKEVLCLAFAYLRVITGSGDGKIRIWHMVNGHCLRIIRGNARSDPITQLIAIGNRITINTCNNTVVYNFEPVEYEYHKKYDEAPTHVQFGKYSDVPVRKQEYPYIRAQRMVRAGATNEKIIHHDKSEPKRAGCRHQTAHSAQSLSDKSLQQARRIQRVASANPSRKKSKKPPRYSRSMWELGASTMGSETTVGTTTAGSAHTRATTAASSQRLGSTKSQISDISGIEGDSRNIPAELEVPLEYHRRVSWACEHPFVPAAQELDLASTKSLLRSQMRAKGKVLPPDFVYLKVNSIQQSMKTPDPTKDDSRKQLEEIEQNRKLGRPSSSPSKVDSRTKVPVLQLDWKHLLDEQDEEKIPEEDGDSVESFTTDVPAKLIPTQTTILTEFDAVPLDAKPVMSVHSMKTKSSIPPPKLLRPQTATVLNEDGYYAAPSKAKPPMGRFHSAPLRKPSGTHQRRRTLPTSAGVSRPVSGYEGLGARPQTSQVLSINQNAAGEMPPMLMYSKDMFAKIDEMKQRRAERLAEQQKFRQHPGASGNTSKYNDPLRSHAPFELKTHQQVMQEMANIEEIYQKERERKDAIQEKKQRAAWKAKVTGKSKKNLAQQPIPRSQELFGTEG